MHLSLTFPPTGWIHKVASNEQRAAIRPGTDPKLPAVVVTYGPLLVRPDEPRAWMERVARDAPNLRTKVGRTIERRTTAGWPLTLVEAQSIDATGAIVEARLCAFYSFMEHVAAATVRTRTTADLEAHGAEILAILDQGRPDWRAEPASLADAWEFGPQTLQRGPQRPPAVNIDGAILRERIAAPLPASASASDHVVRGRVLAALGRHAEAAGSFRAALSLDDSSEEAHYLLGVALGADGDHAGAIAAWQRVLATSPGDPDTLYNIGQAHFMLANHADALAAFEQCGDFASLRKIAQCLYALGRFEEGQAARDRVRGAWREARDPRVRLVTEFVFDQFDGAGFRVHAVEPLHHETVLLAFRAVGDGDRGLGLAVTVETSEVARQAGTPFVLAVSSPNGYRVIGASAEIPAYARLRDDVVRLLAEAVKGSPAAPSAT